VTNYVVCGWYTPDYRRWWDALRPTLEAWGAPHDFVEVPKAPGGWEANTMAKPHHLLAALDRHPDKVVIFVDVDCTVHGALEPLARIRGDVAFYIRTKRKRGAKWGSIRSGTLVLRPTPAARDFVETWIRQRAEFGDVDQNTLMLAVCEARCSFEPLPVAYCCIPADKVAAPIIFHDSASAGVAKVGKIAKAAARVGLPRWMVKAMPAKRTTLEGGTA
jgi:hypothetical protein